MSKDFESEIMVTIPVRVTVEEFTDWQNKNVNLNNVLTSDEFENKLKEGYQNFCEQVKKSPILKEKVVMSFEEYTRNIRNNFTGNFASRVFRNLIVLKEAKQTEKETILNEKWVCDSINTITEMMAVEIEKQILGLEVARQMTEDLYESIFG